MLKYGRDIAEMLGLEIAPDLSYASPCATFGD